MYKTRQLFDERTGRRRWAVVAETDRGLLLVAFLDSESKAKEMASFMNEPHTPRTYRFDEVDWKDVDEEMIQRRC